MSDYPHDVLARAAVRVDDTTLVSDLVPEMRERLEALMELYGCDASPDGWRKLALELALKHESVFRVETPADRTGPSGIGGAPIDMKVWRLRHEWLKEMAVVPIGTAEREIARRLERRLGIKASTIRGAVRRDAMSDEMRRANYVVVAEAALASAAKHLVEE